MNQANVSTILSKNYTKPNEKSMTFEDSMGNKTSTESVKEKEHNYKRDKEESLVIQTRERNSVLMKKLAEANEEIEVYFFSKYINYLNKLLEMP